MEFQTLIISPRVFMGRIQSTVLQSFFLLSIINVVIIDTVIASVVGKSGLIGQKLPLAFLSPQVYQQSFLQSIFYQNLYFFLLLFLMTFFFKNNEKPYHSLAYLKVVETYFLQLNCLSSIKLYRHKW